MNNSKEYYEFIITLPDESREAITGKIMDMGSLGFFERKGSIIAYFPYRSRISPLLAELNSFRDVLKSSGLSSAFCYDYSLIPGKDWNESWKKKFKPLNVGKNLTIIPSWLKPETDRIPLLIDPGMAFGTGHHETTRRCLLTIEHLSRTVERESFLDVGTGTGILAICASKLGFHHVTGIDTDQAAVDAARRNAELNGLQNVVIERGTVSDPAGPFNVIAANLFSGILITIAGALFKKLCSGGTALLSGILKGQEGDVIMAVSKAGLSITDQIEDGKWVTLIIRAKEQESKS